MVLLLFIALIFFVIYGSLYPFDFDLSVVTAQERKKFLASWWQASGRGDVLGNVVLFVPFGALGMLTMSRGRSVALHFILISLIGFVVAAGVQVAQLAIPARNAVLGDVLWNMLGLIFGALPLASSALRQAILSRAIDASAILPIALIACWYASELAPYVPSIDLQSFKDALKPLLIRPHFSGPEFFSDYVAWLAVAFLVEQARLRMKHWHVLLAAMALMFFAKVIIVKNVVSASDVLAAMAALATWVLFLRSFSHKALVIAALLAPLIVHSELKPYTVYDVASKFQWIPFVGLGNGSAVFVAQELADKRFQFGTLVLLLIEVRVRQSSAVLICIGFVAAIEVMQIWIGDRSPGITDPIIVLLVGLAITKLRKSSAPDHTR